MDEIRKIPPFTRTVVGGVLAATLPCLLQVLSPYRLAFLPHRIAANWELQRIVTPFLFGGGGLPLVFNMIMLYRSLNELETGHFGSRLAEMTWAFVLICGGIIGLNTPLGTPFLFNPFLMAITHLWAQANPTSRVSLYGILTIPAVYFPFALLGMDLLNGGPPAVLVSVTGIVAAHAYWFISNILPRQNGGRQNPLLASLLTPPDFLVRQLGNGAAAPSSRSGMSSFGGQRLGGSSGGSRLGGLFGGGNAGNAPTAAAGGDRVGSTGVRQAGEQSGHAWGSGSRLGGQGL
ncbi:hypothetical protein JCM11641_005690 [Rhodosporidiobolus odoratus]